MGAYHTLDLEQNRKFTLEKAEWDSVALERIDQACDPTRSADLGAIVMQEGLAHICLVTPCMTLVRAKVEACIPRKRKGQCSQHDKVICNTMWLDFTAMITTICVTLLLLLHV